MEAGAPPSLNLRVTAGNAVGTEVRVEDELLIGRQAEGAGRLAEDVELSREHALIKRADGTFTIEDLESTNGTFVNTRRISRPEPLQVGDRIEVGTTTLVVQFTGTSAFSETPASPAVPEEGDAGEEAPAAADAAAADTETAPEAETAPDTAGAPAAEAEPLPKVALRVEIDLEAGEAHVELEEGSDRVRLVHEEGRWRIAPEG